MGDRYCEFNFTVPVVLLNCIFAWDNIEYEQAVQQFYKQEKLCHTEYLLRTMKSNTDWKNGTDRVVVK